MAGRRKVAHPRMQRTLMEWLKSTEHIYEGMPMVRTTSGFLEPWNREKIIRQLLRETQLAKEMFSIAAMNREDAEKIALEVENRIRSMKLKFVSGPLIREIINNMLLEKSDQRPEFVIYRNILTRVGAPVYDAYLIDIGEGFEAKENANLQPNPETSHKKKADRMSKEQYLLLMHPRIADAHLKGDIHIHDLEYFGTRPFCQNWDLRYFFYYGLMPDGIGFKTSVAGPAKHAEVAVLHSVKALAAAQTNFSGGEGYYNYLVFLAPYVRGLSYDRIKQLMQMMFYEFTQAYVARGGQLIFSNIQIQPGVPEIWKDKPIVMHGKVGPDTYGEYEDEVRMLFKALYEVAYAGDYWGKPFNFPKLENELAKEFLTSEYDELWLDVHKAVARFGIPYFDNNIPAYRGYGKGVSCYQCCAYVFTETPESDPEFQEKMEFVDGKHFSMGSWQVVTLNLPRAAYRAEGDEDKLFDELVRLMDLAIDVFEIKQRWMKLMLKNNRLPFATQKPRDPRTGKRGPPAVDFKELVYVIGIVGGNEFAQYATGYQLHEHKEAVKFLVKVLLEMRKYIKELEERTGLKLALARTPAESCAQRLAIADLMHDEFRHKAEKVVKGDLEAAKAMLSQGERDVPIYYSNGTHTYVGASLTLAERIEIEHKFFPVLSGGNMFHIWLGEAYPSPEALLSLTKKIATETQIGYFAYTKDLTICERCGQMSSGLQEQCPSCRSTEVRYWSRVTGYYQDVSGWNAAKKKELMERYRITI